MSTTDVDPDRPIVEMRVRDARVAIGRITGIAQSPSSMLCKRCLNSMCAYLSGEFLYKPAMHDTHLSPSKEFVRERVIELASDTEEYEQRPFSVDFDEYYGRRPFRKYELLTLLWIMRRRDDQRAWTPD